MHLVTRVNAIPTQALSYSNSRSSDRISHIRSIFTCTYGILFFGTPHHGSSNAKLLGTMLKLCSKVLPKQIAQFESSLVSALKEESETLQNITDYFVPLMKNFCIYFFWEEERTNLGHTKDYIVDKESAAPTFDDTERSGIAADHSGMVKFEDKTSQGFRQVVAALDRYCDDAPSAIKCRWANSMELLAEARRREADDKIRRFQTALVACVTWKSMLRGSMRVPRKPRFAVRMYDLEARSWHLDSERSILSNHSLTLLLGI